MLRIITRLMRDRAGATAIEYALIAGVTAVAVIVTLPAVTPELVVIFENVVAGLAQPTP